MGCDESTLMASGCFHSCVKRDEVEHRAHIQRLDRCDQTEAISDLDVHSPSRKGLVSHGRRADRVRVKALVRRKASAPSWD